MGNHYETSRFACERINWNPQCTLDKIYDHLLTIMTLFLRLLRLDSCTESPLLQCTLALRGEFLRQQISALYPY